MTETIPDKVLAGILDSIPFKRFAEAEEIAAVHAWLASKESAYITGQVLFVDGGITAGP
jgi:3-oxoacyl-[acyl-carrier protein] reductase